MKKKFKLIILAISLAITSVVSVGFVDNYFEIAKNLDIFTTLYKELNTFYVDENVVPDTRYFYTYKVLRTNFTETNYSKVVDYEL